jgi:drug/metabolite transporter (DMT)-like permease
MRYMGPFAFNAIRFILGGIVLLPVIAVRDHVEKKTSESNGKKSWLQKELIIAGLICGGILCVANGFQQMGIKTTSVGKAGFITTLYIIMVPIIGIFLKKKPPIAVWFSAVMAVIGLYLLCMKDNSGINTGDLYLLICAFLFSFHILVIDHFSPKVDGVKLSCLQFFVSGFFCMLLAIAFETITWQAIIDCSIPILYAGIMSCGVAYTCQILGQKYMDPAVASLILSLESVVAVLAGWIILGQVLTIQEMIGCGIVFVAVVLAQVPARSKIYSKKNQVNLVKEGLEETA